MLAARTVGLALSRSTSTREFSARTNHSGSFHLPIVGQTPWMHAPIPMQWYFIHLGGLRTRLIVGREALQVLNLIALPVLLSKWKAHPFGHWVIPSPE